MADEADLASELAHISSSAEIARVRREAAKPLPTSPVCLWCNGVTENGARWCCASCRDQWQVHGECDV